MGCCCGRQAAAAVRKWSAEGEEQGRALLLWEEEEDRIIRVPTGASGGEYLLCALSSRDDGCGQMLVELEASDVKINEKSRELSVKKVELVKRLEAK
ncbi:hypothetical protein EJB05_45196, partial [Eragrostis curvula]